MFQLIFFSVAKTSTRNHGTFRDYVSEVNYVERIAASVKILYY